MTPSFCITRVGGGVSCLNIDVDCSIVVVVVIKLHVTAQPGPLPMLQVSMDPPYEDLSVVRTATTTPNNNTRQRRGHAISCLFFRLRLWVVLLGCADHRLYDSWMEFRSLCLSLIHI